MGDLLLGGLALVGAADLWKRWLRRRYAVRIGANERHFATTADGWRLALTRYRPAPGSPPRLNPVLMCHGLAASHLTWDLSPESSLARHLAAQGWDVFTVDLRAHGASDWPRWFSGRTWRFGFDAFVRYDVPALVDRVRALTGAERVHWVGHSMGGLVAYATIATGDAAAFASVVTVGSSLNYSGTPSQFHALLRFRPLARILPVLPLAAVLPLTAPLIGRLDTPVERFNWWPENMDVDLMRRMTVHGMASLSTTQLAQLASAFEPEGLHNEDATIRYAAQLPGKPTPVLALAGTRDRQCPPAAAARMIDALGEPSRLRVFGREHGHAVDYGHFDLIAGRQAPHDTWPEVADWLARWD